MHSKAPVALAAIVGLAFAACSGGGGNSGGDSGANTAGGTASSKTTTGSGAPDACALLTSDQIKAQFGVTVGPGTPSSTGGAAAPECTWQPVEFSTQLGGVNLTVQKDANDGFFEYTRTGAKDRVDISGLGKAAFFEAPANPYTLWISQGDYLYTFYVVAAGGTPADNEQKVIALAKLALPR